MIKNTVKLVVALFLVSLFAAPSFAWGNRGPNVRQFQREWVTAGIYRKLDLTKEQKEKFKKDEEKTKEMQKAKHKEIAELGDKIKLELKKDQPDRKAVRGHITKMGEIRTEMELKRMDRLFELREMLTPEQKEKFDKMLGEKKARFGKRDQRKK